MQLRSKVKCTVHKIFRNGQSQKWQKIQYNLMSEIVTDTVQNNVRDRRKLLKVQYNRTSESHKRMPEISNMSCVLDEQSNVLSPVVLLRITTQITLNLDRNSSILR